MQWNTICGNTGVIDTGFLLIPAYRPSARELILIDSGSGPMTEFFDALEAEGVRISAVLCTHCHPDHIANNRELLRRFDAEIYASAEELPMIRPWFDRLRDSPSEQQWLYTEPDYPITPIDPARPALAAGGAVFGVIPTPGHTRGHLSFVTPDGVCCLGDALLSEDVLQNSRLPYMDDCVDRAITSMLSLREGHFPYYVAVHREVIPAERIAAAVDANIGRELEIYARLREMAAGPVEPEQLVTELLISAGVRPYKLERESSRHSARVRGRAMLDAGGFHMEDGRIAPD